MKAATGKRKDPKKRLQAFIKNLDQKLNAYENPSITSPALFVKKQFRSQLLNLQLIVIRDELKKVSDKLEDQKLTSKDIKGLTRYITQKINGIKNATHDENLKAILTSQQKSKKHTHKKSGKAKPKVVRVDAQGRPIKESSASKKEGVKFDKSVTEIGRKKTSEQPRLKR